MPECNTRKIANPEDECIAIKAEKSAKSRRYVCIQQIGRLISNLHYRLTDVNIGDTYKKHIIASTSEKIKDLANYLSE